MGTDSVNTGAPQDDAPNKESRKMRDTFSLRDFGRSVIRWYLAPRNAPTVPHTVACQKALDALVSCPPPEKFPSYPLVFMYNRRRGQWVAISTRDHASMTWGPTLFLVSLAILLWAGFPASSIWLVHAF